MEPVINLEETIGKTVGRRMVPAPLRLTRSEKISNQQWRNAGIGPRIKPGVYRFHSHEEADQWLMDRLTRKEMN